MATIVEITYDIRELLKKFTDDTILTDRYIIHKVNTVRNKLLERSLNNFKGIKGQSVLQNYFEDLEEVSSYTSGNFNCNTLLRTVNKVPQTLQIMNTQSLVRIKPVDMLSTKINFTTLDRLEYVAGATFKSNMYAFLDASNYLYIYSPKGDYKNMKQIEITGIFSNPLDLENFKKGNNTSTEIAYDKDVDHYPIFDHMINDIVNIVYNQLVQREQLPMDRQNNADEQ
jgi:hypothetical protein